MENGYYLSAYIHIDELSYLYHLKVRHDQNISLWEKRDDKIELIHYWEIERLSGIKRHNLSFYSVEQATAFINMLLAEYNLSINDMQQVWGTPELQGYNKIESKMFEEYTLHNMAHLFSALLFDSHLFFSDNILAMAVDAGPDFVLDSDYSKKYMYSGCVDRKGDIEFFPISSPGLLWVYFRKKYYNLREGTLMALASACKSKLIKMELPELKIEKLGDWDKMAEAVDHIEAFVEGLTENDKGILFSGYDDRFSIEENKISMMMKAIQTLSLKIMEKNIAAAIIKYGINPEEFYLAISGGYALNCPTNSYLMQKYKFKGFIAPPNVSDTGISLGYALMSFYLQMGNFSFDMRHAFYGKTENNFNDVIGRKKYILHINSISAFDIEKIVEDLKAQPIAWFQDAAEIGPRALGHRSILADPTTSISKDKLNDIKERQWWRPVAPIVLAEDVGEWFEDSGLSPFMLQTFYVKKEKRDLVPAVLHLDHSARVQTLQKKDNELLYEVIKKFKEKYGVPMICNTSLNDRNEPIVNSIEDALNFAIRKKLRIIYIHGYRVELKEFEAFEDEAPNIRRYFYLFHLKEEKAEQMKSEMNPFSLSREEIIFYVNNARIRNKYDLRKEKDVRLIRMYADIQHKREGIVSGI